MKLLTRPRERFSFASSILLLMSVVLSEILNKEINLSNKDFERYIGKKDEEIYEMFKIDFNVDFNTKEMVDKKVETAKKLLLNENVEIYKYFYELLKQKDNKKFYIVSNQDENLLLSVLKHKNILKYFDDVFCLPKLSIKKDYFYQNIKDFIPKANNILVFEDDVKVLNFLKSIGYNVVAIKNEMNKQTINFEKFKYIIDC